MGGQSNCAEISAEEAVAMECREDQQQSCKACGRVDHFNFYVPDSIWEAVAPNHLRSLVICLPCFDAFAAERGVQYATHLTDLCFAGQGATFFFDTAKALDA